MKTLCKLLVLSIVVSFIATSCTPDSVDPKAGSPSVGALLSPGEHPVVINPCTGRDTFPLVNRTGNAQSLAFPHEFGIVEITNDPQNYILMMTTGMGWYVNKAQLYVGSDAGIPLNALMQMDVLNFPFQYAPFTLTTRIRQEIPASTFTNPCNTFVFHATLYQVAPLTGMAQPNSYTEVWAKLQPIHNGFKIESCFVRCTNTPQPTR